MVETFRATSPENKCRIEDKENRQTQREKCMREWGWVGVTETERHTETMRQTHKKRERVKNRQRQRERNRDRETNAKTEIETHTEERQKPREN